MDPARQLAHLYLSAAEGVLTRTLDVVRLVDGLLVSTAQSNAADARQSGDAWPEEETGDLGSASSALRARAESPGSRVPAAKSVAAKKAAAKKAPAKKAPAKKAPAKKAAAKEAPSRATGTKKAPAAKKTAAKKSVTKKTSTGSTS